jgi:hypothetical protein
MNELMVGLTCGCGRMIFARRTDAGGVIACECGRAVPVPRLSRLRELAGADAYVTNPAEAIRKAQSEGHDPAGDHCLLCGSATPLFYTCNAICERSHMARSPDDSSSLVQWFFLPWFLNLLLYSRRGEVQADRRGHDVEVNFKLPVCGACAQTQGDVTRASVAKRIMARVPMYAELLEYYSGLKLKIQRPLS